MTTDIVIPTVGRPSLGRLLARLVALDPPLDGLVTVVDDRRGPCGPLGVPDGVRVVRGRSAGPAAARNRGWRASQADWVVFLDDDTVPTGTWSADLRRDLCVGDGVAGSQGVVVVPRPQDRRPTDAERGVIALEHARFATADMAYRRDVLEAVHGFDERFPRAYREDADIALRILRTGRRIEQGRRRILHPIPPGGGRPGHRRQAGNRDDVLMRVLHGPGWRTMAGAPRGRLRRHAAVTAAGAVAVAAAVAGRRRLAGGAALAWALGTAEFAASRIAAGPRSGREIAEMAWTSAAIPPLAVHHALAGVAELPRRLASRPDAILLDRDGTLVVDVPYNGDPGLVVPMPGAAAAVRRLREAGIPLAVVTNQSGVARGLLTAAQVASVNRRVEELLGPIGCWQVCPHDERDGCGCRKPAPGLVLAAARELGVDPRRAAVVGDTGADVAAAHAAGARGILVPNDVTRAEEVLDAPEVAASLPAAVDALLGAAS